MFLCNISSLGASLCYTNQNIAEIDYIVPCFAFKPMKSDLNWNTPNRNVPSISRLLRCTKDSVKLSRIIRKRAPKNHPTVSGWRVTSITASGSWLSHWILQFEKICELAGSPRYLRWNRTPDSVLDIGYHKWISCRCASMLRSTAARFPVP